MGWLGQWSLNARGLCLPMPSSLRDGTSVLLLVVRLQAYWRHSRVGMPLHNSFSRLGPLDRE